MSEPVSLKSGNDDAGACRRRRIHAGIVCACAIVIACVLVYGRLAGYDFVEYDDQVHIFENPYFTPLRWSGVLALWRHPYQQLYIPVSYTMFAFLCLLSRSAHPERFTETDAVFNPHYFHAANIILHILNTLFVFYLIRRIVKNDAGALAGALLFGLHPLQVESVGWISELRGQLSALLGFMSMTGYVVAWDRVDAGGDQMSRRRQWQALAIFAAAFFLFVLALLAKPTAVVYPVVTPLVDSLIHRRPWLLYVREFAPWAIVSAIFTIAARNDQFIMGSANSAPYLRPFIAGDALMFYLKKLLVPASLAIDYGLTPRAILSNISSFELALAPIVLMGVVVWLRKRWPWLLISTLISLACLAPNIGLTPFSFQYYSTVADRYAYLALTGPAIALAYAVARIRSPWLLTAPAVLLIACGVISAGRCQDWQNTISIMRAELAVNPGSAIALVDVGNYYQDHGDHQMALREYALSRKYRPDLWRGYYNAATSLMALGRVREAMSMYLMTFNYNGGFAPAHTDMGNALVEAGRPEAALTEFEKSLKIDKTADGAHLGEGMVYLALRQYSKAAAEFDRQIATDNTGAPAYIGKGLALIRMGQKQSGQSLLDQGQNLEDSDEEWHADLGKVEMLAGDYADARRDLEQSLSLYANQGHTRFLLDRVISAQDRLKHGLPPIEY